MSGGRIGVGPRFVEHGPAQVFGGRPTPAEHYDVTMAGMAELRERQRIRGALIKGDPIPIEDYGTVREIIAQVSANRLYAVCFAALGCVWLFLALLGHGAIRWVGILWVVGAPLMAWSLLRQRKRILDGASKIGFRRQG